MAHYPGLRPLPPDPATERSFSIDDLGLPSLNISDSTDKLRQISLSFGARSKPRILPPKVLPCAHVHPSKYFACDNPGSKICSGCRLVSYCSKECQQAHWKAHKEACKMQLKSDGWKPAWRVEDRPPMFIADDHPTLASLQSGPGGPDALDGGCALWGNMPAVDVLNLTENESDMKRDLSLAFVASGDLRNVMKTVNSLPEQYSGHLDILVNDLNPYVTGRNVVLLLILGSLLDEDIAVDAALHFWYSAFMPAEYRIQFSSAIAPFMHHVMQRQANGTGLSAPYRLGSRSNIFAAMTTELKLCLQHYISSDALSTDAAQTEYNRVRQAPSRRDYRDRMYCQLKPSHRVAFHRYRHHGLVLPFGAPNAHFNIANASLFSFGGKWLQTDFADPLEGWNVGEIVQVGQAHGAQPEDIYGCLYFFLSDQLRLFYKNIRERSLSFTVISLDALELSESIASGGPLSAMGLGPSTRFDRVDVSNILDPNYVGLKATITAWEHLLARQKSAVIVGYFMNWFLVQKDARAMNAGEKVIRQATQKLLSKLKSTLNREIESMGNAEAALFSMMGNIDAVYENSGPFLRFLRTQDLKGVLKATGLALRDTHRIAPHRLMVHISAPSSALPEFPDEDSWYYHTKLANFTWVERYVEFERRS